MSKLLLFVIFLSIIILGVYLNYPIEELTTQGDNGVNYKNYHQCLKNAKDGKCSEFTGEEVLAIECNPNYLKDEDEKLNLEDIRKKLCLNAYDDEPRGFGCESDVFGEQGSIPEPVTGCNN